MPLKGKLRDQHWRYHDDGEDGFEIMILVGESLSPINEGIASSQCILSGNA